MSYNYIGCYATSTPTTTPLFNTYELTHELCSTFCALTGMIYAALANKYKNSVYLSHKTFGDSLTNSICAEYCSNNSFPYGGTFTDKRCYCITKQKMDSLVNLYPNKSYCTYPCPGKETHTFFNEYECLFYFIIFF